MRTYCFGLPPKPSVYLIAIVDIILGSVALLLSVVALSDLEKVFGPLETRIVDEVTFELYNRLTIQNRLDRFGHLHGQMVLLLLISGLFLVLALGLFSGVRKDWAWPIKSWLIYGCTLTLLGAISICVVTIMTNELMWLLLLFLGIMRIYEMWVVFDYLRHSRFCTLISISRSSSSERLHNV